MPLSTIPSGGPSLPDGVQRVSIKEVLVGATTEKEDVTVLGDTERQYAEPPLKEGTAATPTKNCSANGLLEDGPPAITPMSTSTGWICEESEVSYEVGKYATWSGTWNYYED